jgi:omega-6 fatty acid desaturase (delta-12 desaturase)
MTALREGSELIRASRAFAQEDARRTWQLFAITLLTSGALFAASLFEAFGPLRWVFAIVQGLVIVRVFIFFHDALHGAIFRKDKLGHALMSIYGVFVLTPVIVWKDSHNYHHAHTSKLVGSSIGSYPIVTKRMYAMMTPTQRLMYRFIRHWATILFGYVFMFLIGMVIQPLVKQPKRYWSAALVLVGHYAILAALVMTMGWETAIVAYLAPVFVACAAGSYLFYAQHTFEGVELRDRRGWEYTAAALRSSSMMDMSPLMHWFTGNIGYHHVHHLNSMIPFYRLPEAMDAIPELQSPRRTSLALREIWHCLNIHVWDPAQQRMISFREADASVSSTEASPPGDAALRPQ